jgi:dUTPase
MKILFERYPELRDEIKPLHKKYSNDGGIDFQIFGIGTASTLTPDELPPLIPADFSVHLIRDITYKTFCGIRINIPTGHVGLFLPRSSARRKGLIVSSVWDAGHTGWVSPFITLTQSFSIMRGERLFQMVVLPIPTDTELEEIDFNLIETERGDQGIGSTGRL